MTPEEITKLQQAGIVPPTQAQLEEQRKENQARESEQRAYEESIRQQPTQPAVAQQKREQTVTDTTDPKTGTTSPSAYDWLRRVYNIESKEDQKKRERRDRARKILSAVGDGLTALTNMHFAFNGGTPLVKPKLNENLHKRLLEERKYRDTNRDRFVSAYTNLEKMKQNAKYRDDLAAYRAELAEARRAENERKKAKDEEDAKHREWQRQYKEGELDLKREHEENDRLYKEGKITNEEWKLRIADLNAKTSWLKAQGYNVDITKTDKNGEVTKESRKNTPVGNVDQSGKKPLPNSNTKKKLPTAS